MHEARRLYGLGLSLRAVAETLLDQTRYASVNSAEVALRFQFKRRGWPLRTRAQARRAAHPPATTLRVVHGPCSQRPDGPAPKQDSGAGPPGPEKQPRFRGSTPFFCALRRSDFMTTLRRRPGRM